MIFVLPKIRKSTSRAISILILANTNIFSKNSAFLFIFLIKKAAIIILYIVNNKSSIFLAFILVFKLLNRVFLKKKLYLSHYQSLLIFKYYLIVFENLLTSWYKIFI